MPNANTTHTVAALPERAVKLLTKISKLDTPGVHVLVAGAIDNDGDRRVIKQLAESGWLDFTKDRGVTSVALTSEAMQAMGIAPKKTDSTGTKAATKTPKPSESAKPTERRERVKDRSDGTLNWAFRRLRRQLVLWLAGSDSELRKTISADLSAHVSESYSALKTYATSELADHFKRRDAKWDDFMESFFDHVIIPGSRKSAE